MKISITLLVFLICGMISFSQTKYDEYYNSSITYLRSDDLDMALSNINEAIKLKPTTADAYYIRGNIYQKMDSYPLTMMDYEKAIALNPKHVDALLKCAIMYGKNNNREKACEYLKRACDLGSGDACSGNNKFCNQ